MPLSNARLSDILYAASLNHADNKARALRRAGRHALSWPEEAAEVEAGGRSLTELPAVGPWVARIIHELLDDPPPEEERDELRLGFQTMAEARKVLADHPEWKEAVRGDLQMHSVHSDGVESIAAMARGAVELNYSYIAITDHSKGLRIAGGMDEERLAAQVQEIEELNLQLEELGAELLVLRSIELNFDTAGQVDMEPEALQTLDLCVGSFHSKLRVKTDQTDRLMGAMRHPEVQIIGHPQGRMFGVRKGVQGEWERVVGEGARYGKAFEINAQPDRQDFNIEMLMMAKEYPVMFSIGTDAHSIPELYNIDLSLAAAITAGIPRERILNFMEPAELLTWVGSSREQAASAN